MVKRDIKGSMVVRVGDELGLPKLPLDRTDPICDEFGRQLVVGSNTPHDIALREPFDLYERYLSAGAGETGQPDPRDTFRFYQSLINGNNGTWLISYNPCIHISSFGYNYSNQMKYIQYWDQPDNPADPEPDYLSLSLLGVFPVPGNNAVFSLDCPIVAVHKMRIAISSDALSYTGGDPGVVFMTVVVKELVQYEEPVTP